MENETFLAIIEKAKEGDEVALTSIHNNLKSLIRSVWENDYSDFISFDDAFDVSFFAIYNAARNFNPNKNVQFKTYALPYIKGEIINEINSKRGIVMPEKISRNAPKVYEIIQDYASEHEGSEPSDDELKEILSSKNIVLSNDEIAACRDYYMSINTYSLDSEDFYETSELASSDEYLETDINDIIADAASLDEKERKVLPHLDAYLSKEMTLKDISSCENMSIDVTRSVVESCIAKIKKKRKRIKKIYNNEDIKESADSQDEIASPFEYEYEFTDEDRKIIGNNIKTLREANDCDNTTEFYEFLNRPQKLSPKTLSDIENGIYKQISKGKIFDIARLLQSNYEYIVFEEINKESIKDFYSLEDDEHPLEFIKYLNDDGMKDAVKEFLDVLYPLVTSKEAQKSKDFLDAMNLWEKLMWKEEQIDMGSNVEKIVSSLEKAYKKDNLPEACFNTLSILGTCYLAENSCDDGELTKMLNTDYDNRLDYLSKLARNKSIIEEVALKKEKFIKKYDDCLLKNMARLMKTEKYNDYAVYYLATRYANTMLDSNKTKLSIEEMAVFGISLLRILHSLKNKYAIKYYKYLESD